MKKRWYFIPLFSLIIILLLVGTFCDLTIAKALAHPNNGFSRFMCGFGPIPISIFAGFVAGCFFKKSLTFKNKVYKVLIIIFSIAILLLGSFTGCIELSSYYAYNLKYIYSVLIGLLFAMPGIFISFKFFDKFDSKYLLHTLFIMGVLIGMAAILIEVFKICVPRIRYNSLVHFSRMDWYRPWYDPSISNEIVDTVKGFIKNEAKSFPSGHASSSLTILAIMFFFPRVDKRLIKHQNKLFVIGLIYYFIVVFSRLLQGAHYLSDTMFGSLTACMLFFIANEIYLRKIEPLTLKEKPNEIN